MSDDDNGPSYRQLEAKLGYSFHERARLEAALTHKSYLNENPNCGRGDNERLEFLGDAVLDLVVSHLLMEEHPARSEGELSKARAAIVNEAGLADVARELGLGEWLFLGRGEEQSGGRRKPSVMADACEAVIAGVYLDGGFHAAYDVVRHLFASRLASQGIAGRSDYKTRLQERAAQKRLTVRYQVTGEHGPDHAKTFDVVAWVGERELGRASGRTKKEAEQRAAELALRELEVTSPGTR